jgi:colanic acid/amylovoran biosynthesis glycosyltransferase
VISALRNQTIAIERCDAFVGRTTNWLYDHLRLLRKYLPLVLCDRLENRVEFADVEAWKVPSDRLSWRLWRRVTGNPIYPAYARRLRRLNPQVLHSHFGYVAEGDVSLQRMLGCPWIVSFYGADVYELGHSLEWRDRYRPVFREAAAVLALGPAMAKGLVDLGCPAEKVIIHALGVDSDSIPHAPRQLAPGDTLRMLFAGTFREKKGVRYLLEAVRHARDAGVRLHLDLVGDAATKPGDEETKAEIFGLLRSLGLGDVVHHRPFMSFHDLMAFALRTHVFVAPSITAKDGDAEGTPFVIQQMMASGMPVISTVHSDIPFVFGAHAHLLVPERDARAIADRIVQYATCPERLIQDGRVLRDQIRAHFESQARADALVRLYDRFASHRA